jgi:hypothetical protein
LNHADLYLAGQALGIIVIVVVTLASIIIDRLLMCSRNITAIASSRGVIPPNGSGGVKSLDGKWDVVSGIELVVHAKLPLPVAGNPTLPLLIKTINLKKPIVKGTTSPPHLICGINTMKADA